MSPPSSNGSPDERHAAMIEAARRQDELASAVDTSRIPAVPQSPAIDHASTAVSSSGPPSDSFTGYHILREIHRGGQGVVYQAFQKSTNRKVAIKVMHQGPFAGPPDKARFEREVQVLGQLQHPNIVTIHDSGTAAGCDYFVMDYISGQSLDVYMAGAKSRKVEESK